VDVQQQRWRVQLTLLKTQSVVCAIQPPIRAGKWRGRPLPYFIRRELSPRRRGHVQIDRLPSLPIQTKSQADPPSQPLAGAAADSTLLSLRC
jgi:hypothetical protein